ncbi:MAG TPA: tRNA epoxyqueuosine(34) reductase QueG [Spirochaetia bacterium]|nr:tRNA epoxyqueuosine(34) reductase QueG [Spirochaetia bacterium]
MIAREPFFPQIDNDVRELFANEGLELVGVADALPSKEARLQFEAWVASGYAGSMDYLSRHARMKYDPEKLLPGVRSILFAAINYFQRPDKQAEVTQGRIARYAWGRDYHKALGGRLRRIVGALCAAYPTETFRSFTDSTPLGERFYAERAGIGFTGRNTLLISSQFGSWFLLGEILSTRRFEPSGPVDGRHGACPGNCRRCLDICPTGALIAAGRIDASRCISYLTIEHRGSIPEELRPKMGNWLFGCDLCQEVCPLNLRERGTDVKDFIQVKAGATQELAAILSIPTDEEFTRRYAGSPLMRAGRSGLVRNACIVAANNGAVGLLRLLRTLIDDADDVIAEHALWAVDRLTAGARPSLLDT